MEKIEKTTKKKSSKDRGIPNKIIRYSNAYFVLKKLENKKHAGREESWSDWMGLSQIFHKEYIPFLSHTKIDAPK